MSLEMTEPAVVVGGVPGGCANTACAAGISDYASLSTCHDGSRCIKLDHEDSPVPVLADSPDSSFEELARKLCAEALGTCLLLTVVIGSGIMAETLSPNDVGLQLLENSISVGFGLIGLILMFGPVSGAHFNPVVSLVDYLNGDMSLRDLGLYVVVQFVGGILGALLADAQFDVAVQTSSKARDDSHLWLGEVIATVTLLLVIHGTVRTGQKATTPFAVGAWVCSGHFFTSSTIFANPAVTVARQFSNTFAGIHPDSVGAFVGFQLLGALIGFVLVRFFYPVKHEMRRDDNLYMRVCVAAAKRDDIVYRPEADPVPVHVAVEQAGPDNV
jgi:glycerol uptake facilitator-like aquaporin